MSKLEQLIKELCPNGVDYIPINKCIEKTEKINWKSETNSFQYIDLTSVDRDTHLIEDTITINAENAPSRAQQIVLKNDILLGTTRPMLKRYCIIPADYNNQICSTGFCVLRAKTSVVLTRWLFHNISSTAFFVHVEKNQQGASYPAISEKDVKSFKIPVPPIEVQREIVKILDEYTESVTALQQELEAELTARKKQYEYYRDLLLDFGVHGGTSECEWRTINDIAIKVASGKNKEKKQEGAYPVYGSTGIIAYCDKFEYNKKQILIARVGANAGYVHIADGEYDVSDNTVILDVNDSVIFEYIYYLLVNMNLNRFAKGGGQPLVTAGQIKEIKIPIPPIEEQERIVSILDRFDKLCNDISEGLPAEIEARRKQYEYYRDKLLSFEEMRT